MTDRNNWEKSYYIDRDGNRIQYDPNTMQPPIVYGESPFTDDDLNDEEAIYDHGADPERHGGIPTHYMHGLYAPYPYPGHYEGDYPPAAEPNCTPEYLDQLAEEKGRFHIRYYGTVEHSMSMPFDPTRPDKPSRGGLISLAIRDDNDKHLHTDVHTFNPLSLLNEVNCPEGTRVRVDIQDWDNVIKDYIYNYPVQLCPGDLDLVDELKSPQTYLSLGQYDGNKKMALTDFLDVFAAYFHTDIGDLQETLAQYQKDHEWIVKAPTQVGMSLEPDDGVCLPYCQFPLPAVKGDFTYNPATHIGVLSFNYVCHIIIPNRDTTRVFEMRNPYLFHSGTVPTAVCPKQPMRLVSYAHVSIRRGCSEIVEEDTDTVDLLIEPDGSVRIDGSLWLQHHKIGTPKVEENDRWRIEISSNNGVILL